MPDTWSAPQTRSARASAQLLTGPPPDVPGGAGGVAAVAARLVGLQAQDVRANRLSVRARSTGWTRDDVDRAVADAAVVRTWAMRGTLHMLATADVGWVVGLLGPRFADRMAPRRRVLGLDDDTCARALAAIPDVLTDGPLTRRELVTRLVDDGLVMDTDTQAPAHLVAYAACAGVICRGPDRGDDEPTYVPLASLPGAGGPIGEEAARAELARRYLAGYGPASAEDFAAWSGLPLGPARAGFAAIEPEVRPVETADGPCVVLGEPVAPGRPRGVRLLGHFDPYLLGYRTRGLVVPDGLDGRLQSGGGFVMPAVLHEGRVVGVWSQKHRARRTDVVVEPFRALPAAALPGLRAEVADLGRFLGVTTQLEVSDPA